MDTDEESSHGLALLYSVTSRQQDVNKLLWIKDPGESVEAWIREIASYNQAVTAELKSWEDSGQAGSLSDTGLPEAELKAREIATRHTAFDLLMGTGTDLRISLVVTQLKALAYCADLCKAVADLPEGKAHESQLQAWAKGFAALNAKGFDLLAMKLENGPEEKSQPTPPPGPPARRGM